MDDDDIQFVLPGWPEPDPNVPPVVDEWDQQVDETEEEWNTRLDRAREEAGADPVIHIPDAILDQCEDQQRDETPRESECTCQPGDEEACSSCLAKLPRVTTCPPPASPMTADALLEMANTALAKINEEKELKRQKKMEVLRETVGPADYIQESFVPTHCQQEGGDGSECMMCCGTACRFCGAGCWDTEIQQCDHEIMERHSWDPELEDARRDEMKADLRKLGMSEERRKQMLAKIFDGKPSRPTVVYCHICNKEIQTGDVVLTSSKGVRHVRKCLNDTPM